MSSPRHAKRRIVPATVTTLFLVGAIGGVRFVGREEASSSDLAADPTDALGSGTATMHVATARAKAPAASVVMTPDRSQSAPILVAQLLDPPAPPLPLPLGYRDLLIDPNVAEDPLFTAAAPSVQVRLPGSADIEYRFFDQETRDATSRSLTEQGVGLQLQQDTRSFGRFDVRAAFTGTSADSAIAGTAEGGEVMHLAQRDFALTDSLMMDNELGHIRARVPLLLAQGYRVRLPEPLIEGVSSEARSSHASVRVTSGTLGMFRGRTFPVFSTDYSTGKVSGAAAGARLSQAVEVAAQLWQASDVTTSEGMRSFTSAAGAVRYDGGDTGKVQANVLHNDHGAVGLWLDGTTRLVGWNHLTGVYRMDAGLDWIDRNSAVLSDTQGLYWQGVRRSFRASTILGVDVLKTNVADDASTPTRDSSAVFGSYGYRLNPTLDLNGHLSVGTESVKGAGTQASSDHLVIARGTVNRRSISGQATATVGVSDRSGTNPYQRIDANWDYYWNPIGEFNGLRAGIAQVHQSGGPYEFDETSLRLAGGWTRGRINAGASAHVGYSSGAGDSQTASAVFSLGWQLAPAWQLTGNLAYNENALELIGQNETRVSDRQIFLSLRYGMNWGRPDRLMGAVNGKYGRGTVRGVLFLDKNGNGARDADESGVPSVTVYLDGSFGAETNVSGEFAFSPVASGEHRLRINVANVPLPWELDDERSLTVTVRPRETAVIEVPLVTQHRE